MTDPTDRIRVLHVDDNPEFGELVAVYLEREDDRISVQTAETPDDAVDALDAREIDCVVSDYDMPESNGIEFLETVREEYPGLPFILYTGKGSEEIASDAISAGVTDYLEKESGTSQYAVLANRITNAVEQYRSTRALEASQERLSLFFEQSPLGVVEWTEEFEVARLNEAAEEILGYDEAELRGEPGRKIVSEADREEVSAVVDELLEREGGYHSINENVRKDGERIICEWHNRVVTDDDGEVVAIFSQFQDITERRTQLKELERQRAVIESASNTIVTIDDSSVVQSVNPAVEETFGYSPEELIGEPLTTLMGDDVADRHREAFERYLRTGERTLDWEYTEFEARHRDGSPVPVGVTFGEVVYEEEHWFVGILRDISEQRARKQELEWTNGVLSTLLETLPVGVLAESENREVLAANDRIFELFDLPGTPEETVGADCERIAESVSDQFVDPDGFVARINEIVDTDERVEGEELALADERTFVRTHEPIELPDGDGHLWTYRDITEQRVYEERLAALNELAGELIVADSRQEIAEIGVDAARDVLGLDANAIHLYDADRSALVPAAGTEKVFDLVGEPPTFTEGGSIGWRVFESGEALAVDDTHDDPDIYNPESPIRSELLLPIEGYGILMAGSPTPDTFDQEDLVLGQILAGSLVSAFEQIEQMEQRQARERELETQNERLEEFASIVSHDLRNPLNVAEGRVELAKESGELDHLDAVERAHERMNALIDDLLTLARQGEYVSEIAPVRLDAIAGDCWENVATADATLDVRSDRAVLADRSRLQQLFENLMRNAVEHAGDDVTVSVGELADGFYVADDGSGIPADVREDVFDAGYSTSECGTGFGLRIVKQIATAHDWEIAVEEGDDGGARFEITGVSFADE
jgi:PAS domain S-box-containing protein